MTDIVTFYTMMGVLVLWSLIWKGLALYKAGHRQDKRWFLALFIFNTAGILPIIYLWLKRNKKTVRKKK